MLNLKLIEALNKIQGRVDLLTEDGEYFNNNNSEVQEAESLALEELITSSGQPNYVAILEMAAYGYEVYPGERDSFGWLIGCIQKGDGPILVFG